MNDAELQAQSDRAAQTSARRHRAGRRRPHRRRPVLPRHPERALQPRAARLAGDVRATRTATATCRARGIRSRRSTSCWPIAGSSPQRISRPSAAINRTTSAIPTRHIPGIEMNTGALGHGLPICVGMALAAKMDGAPYRVFTLLGDGELAEGSNWEAAPGRRALPARQPRRHPRPQHAADHRPHARRDEQRTARREVARLRLGRARGRRPRLRRTHRRR